MKHYKILLIPSLKQLWILATVHYYDAELNSKTNIAILTSALLRTTVKYSNKDINLHVQVKIVVAFWNNLHQVR
jgi:hypothetical protein